MTRYYVPLRHAWPLCPLFKASPPLSQINQYVTQIYAKISTVEHGYNDHGYDDHGCNDGFIFPLRHRFNILQHGYNNESRL